MLNLIFVAAQIVRLRYEERLLEQTFPEYAAYRAQTSALSSFAVAWRSCRWALPPASPSIAS